MKCKNSTKNIMITLGIGFLIMLMAINIIMLSTIISQNPSAWALKVYPKDGSSFHQTNVCINYCFCDFTPKNCNPCYGS